MCAHTLLLVFLRKKLQKPLWNSLLPGFPCIRTPKPLPKHRHIPINSVMFPICFWLFCAIPWAIFFLLFRKKISRNVCRLHPFPFAGRTLKDCLPCLRSEASGGLTYYLLNTFVMMMVSLSLSYLLGLFVKSSNMLNGLSNIVSLGMCFLSGVFVPMSVMDKKVLKIAQFLPVYWYEDINETLARYHSVSGNIATDIWKSLGIEVMFALAFVAIILALSKYKRQK